jgi:general secretion pathway protein C
MLNTAIDWKKGLDPFFTESVQRRIANIVTLLLLLMLAAVLAQLTWKLLPVDDGAVPVITPVQAHKAQAQRSWEIARWHLFGISPDEGRDPRVAVESLPETTLNLMLRGVVASRNEGESGAIIGAPNAIEIYYPVGAKLPGGAVLREIHADRVILERAGRFETLRLPKELLEDAATAASRERGSEQESAPAHDREAVPPRSLREYRDIALTDPQQLSDALAVTPRREDETVIGYEVRPGRDSALLDRLGLMSGDVVTSINGISLDTPERAFSVLRTLSGADQIRLDIQRDGVPQTLIVEIR